MKRLLALLLFAPLCGFAQTYFLQGDAQFAGGDCYLLTEEIGNQNGAVWYADQINLEEPFDIEFLINLGNIDMGGADGICFVLQTVGNNALGDSGGGLGFLGFSPAFGVEFDTWQNGQYGDPTFDHIAMISNGDVSHISGNSLSDPVQASADAQNIEDGEDHIARITWDPETQLIEVFFDCEFRTSATVDIVNQIFSGQTQVYWGFTAATGGSFNNQSVCLQENILTTSPDAFVCEGGSIELSVAGAPDATIEWSPATYLDDPTSQTPICTPDENITYTVTSQDLCGNELTAEVNITVEALIAEIQGGGIITCETTQLELSGDANFQNDLIWNWSTDDGNIIGNGLTQVVSIDNAGTYTLEVSYLDQCSALAEITVEENTTVPLVETNTPEPLTCLSPETLLEATFAENQICEWVLNGATISTEPSLVTNEGGIYFYTVTDPENGCTNTGSLEVIDNIAYPVVNAGTADTLNCFQPEVTIEGASVSPNDVNLSWETADGFIVSGSNSLSPVVNEPGVYTLTAINPDNGCESSADIVVPADPLLDAQVSELVMPNIFSPNNDNVNDSYFGVAAGFTWADLRNLSRNYALRIFNRWGDLVFDTEGEAKAWNGESDSGELSDGTYYYIIDYDIQCIGKTDEPVTGFIKLTR